MGPKPRRVRQAATALLGAKCAVNAANDGKDDATGLDMPEPKCESLVDADEPHPAQDSDQLAGNVMLESPAQLKVPLKNKCKRKKRMEQEEMDKLECATCGARLSNRDSLRRHQRRHAELDGARSMSCDVCPLATSFDGRLALSRHLVSAHSVQPRKCPHCQATFGRADGVTRHLTDVHPDRRAYRCEDCGFWAALPHLLRDHLSSHVDRLRQPFKFPCPAPGCPFATDRPHDLKVHLRTHTGEKPYRCEVCGRTFACVSSSSKHALTHLERAIRPPTVRRPKRFMCETCGFRCDKMPLLRRHEHKHTGRRPYGCPLCPKSFSRKDTLAAHVRRHEDGYQPKRLPQRYLCNECPYGTHSPAHLRQHRRIHTGERPFDCDVCGRGFARRPTLRVHRRIHGDVDAVVDAAAAVTRGEESREALLDLAAKDWRS